MKHILLLVSTLFIFSGCLTKELPAYTNYSLKLDRDKMMILPIYTDVSIYIAQPKALNSLKTKNILYTNGLATNHYALSLWSDEPTKMLQSIIGQYMSSLNQYKYVTTSKLHAQTAFTLYSELTSFHHDIENQTTNFSIRVYLKHNPSGQITSRELNYIAKVEKNDALHAVESFNKSINVFVRDVAMFITKGVDRLSVQHKE